MFVSYMSGVMVHVDDDRGLIMDLEKEIAKLTERRAELERELNSVTKYLEELIIQLRLQQGWIKVVCPRCDGLRWINEHGKRVLCSDCDGRGWIPMKPWKEGERNE